MGLVGASALLLILMLANVIGPFRFTAIDPSQMRNAVGFWIPVDGERPYPPEIARRTEAWRRLVDDDIVIESDRLRDLLNAGVSAVILPDARRLTPDQADAIDRYMMEGGGIVVCGSIGVRGDEDEWLGYAVMRALLRVGSIVPLPREQSDVLAANRRGPLSARLRPGHRLSLVSEPGVPAISAEESELLWAGAADAAAVHAGASRRVRLGRGRLAWVGPGPEVVLGSNSEDVRALERALRNAMAWVRKRPILELRPWPGDNRYAMEIWKRNAGAEAPSTRTERLSFEHAIDGALASATISGVFLFVELPVSGPGDRWAEDLRLRLMGQGRASGAWITTRDQASEWMAMRSNIRLAVDEVGPNRLLVNITNPTDGELRGIGLKLWMNRPASSIQVDAVTVGQVLPTVAFDRASESAAIDLPPLGSGITYAFHIDLDDPDFDETAAVRSE